MKKSFGFCSTFSLHGNVQASPSLLRGLAGKVLLISLAILFFSCCQSDEQRQRRSLEQRAKVAEQERLALKIAVMPTLDCLPAFVARDCNLYDTTVVDIRLKKFNAQMDCDTAFIGGSVEGAFSDFVRMEHMKRHDGVQVEYVSTTDACWSLMASRRARIKKLVQLDDKMVGMTRHSATDMLTTKFFEGIRLKSEIYRIQINDVGIRLAMLLNNEIDAVWLPEPYATQARLAGNNMVADSRDKVKAPGVLAFRGEVKNNSHRRRQLDVFVKAYDMACDSINKNGVRRYADILKRHFGIDDKTIKALPKMKFNHIKKPTEQDIRQVVM